MTIEKIKLHITLKSLRENNACKLGYDRLVAALGTDFPDEQPINLLSCLKSNPVQDVLWALRATTEDSSVVSRLIAADIAETTLHIYEAAYANDRRPRDAIDGARAYANGNITIERLRKLRHAADARQKNRDEQVEILKKYLSE